MIQKGVILAGGSGTRLRPLTKVTSKQLLPVYDEPLIYFPLRTLLKLNIRDILFITAPDHAADFLELLGSGKEFGARFEYTIQEEPRGIAQGLSLAENFVGDENVALILGDNIFFEAFDPTLTADFENGGHIFVKAVEDPERFGVVELENGKVITLEEKPIEPRSEYAQTGLYFYDRTVFSKIRSLFPSARNELEITDLNQLYLEENQLTATILEKEWLDAGTFESLFAAAARVRESRRLEMK